MAEHSYFWPSVNGDRPYTDDDAAEYAGGFATHGVQNGDLAVSAGGNMSIVIPAGRAYVGPAWKVRKYYNDGPLALTIANADGVLNRKDTVVLRSDINTRSVTAQVLQGVPASSPVAPSIVRTAEQYDLKLAEISIPAGTTAITGALITDTRLDSTVCGIVTGVFQQIDTTTFYNQIQADLATFKNTNEADFTAWLASIKDILDADTAGNLLNLINGLQSSKADKSTTTTAALSASDWTGSAAPYSITVTVAGAKPEPTRIELQPTTDATAAQWAAWRAALIRGGGQGTDSITLLADGDKPEIDIPIAVTIRGDVS